MKKLHTTPHLLCLALATTFPVITFAEDDVEKLTKPTSTVSLGVGDINTNNQRYGIYNGKAEADTYLTGEASILRKNADSGTWFRLDARDLGRSTQEFRVEHEKQGDWGYYLDYNQILRYAPYDVHTRLQGIGTNTQVISTPVAAASARTTVAESDPLKTERARTTLGFTKYLNPQLEFAIKFQNETKEGDRLFGHRNANQVFLAEPIDTVTRQVDMTLAYLGEKFQVTGGYYGSFYENRHKAINVSGGGGGGVIALPPDNEAHQWHVAGAYDFTRTTRATFKYAYAKATQTDPFVTGVANISGRTDLGGRLDTELIQAGITSRPITGLSLLANLRYEDRDDKTKTAQYIAITTTNNNNSTDGFNEPRSLKTLNGKLEASYQLGVYRLTGGVDYEEKDRSMAGVRIVGYRAETKETSYRAEVKRSLAESITGTAAYIVSNRTGSNYRTLTYALDTNGPTPYPLYNSGGWLQPAYIADRDRHKFKLLTDWSPTDALSIQFALENSRETYEDRKQQSKDFGVREGDSQLYSLDASYAINDDWRANAYAGYFASRIEQASGSSTAAASYWTAAMKSAGTNFGLGIKGKIGGKFEVGADILWAEDRNTYKLGGAATSLPDINWLQTTFKLFGTYAYDQNTKLRLDYVHDRRKTDDWTWANYTYADGTWLGQEPLEKVHFLGASVQYSFR